MAPALFQENRAEMFVIASNSWHRPQTLRAGFVEVSEARSDWLRIQSIPCQSFLRRDECRTG